jgi:hypothetical protein
MDLDRERQTRPFEGMEVMVPLVIHVRRAGLKTKPGGEQHLLRALGVCCDKIEIAEAAGLIWVPAAQLGSLDEQQWPVVRVPRAGEQDGGNETAYASRALFPE